MKKIDEYVKQSLMLEILTLPAEPKQEDRRRGGNGVDQDSDKNVEREIQERILNK